MSSTVSITLSISARMLTYLSISASISSSIATNLSYVSVLSLAHPRGTPDIDDVHFSASDLSLSRSSMRWLMTLLSVVYRCK